MRMFVWKFMLRRAMIVATVALALPVADGRPCLGGGLEPSGRTPATPLAEDDLDSIIAPDLVWMAREANRKGQYEEAARHARAATRRPGVGPEVLCPAWMNIFYAAHRTGDRNAAAAALRSFDESAARLPANDPVVIEMSELKEALGLEGAVAPAAAVAPPEGDGFWQSADPVAMGLDPEAIREHLALAKASGADAILVAYRGKVVSEWYSSRYRTPAATMSSGWLIADPKGFAAMGYLDTHCYVFPGLELVVARIQARPCLFASEPYQPKALALFKRIVRK